MSPLQGDYHKKQRQMVAPVLSEKVVREVGLPGVKRVADKYLDKWCGMKEVQLEDEARNFAFEIAVNFILGVELSEAEYSRLISEMKTMSNNQFLPDLGVPFGAYHQAVVARRAMADVLGKAYRDFMVQYEAGEAPEGTMKLFVDSGRAEGLDISESSMVDKMINLLFAAFDTTATTFNNMISLLCDHPEVVERMRQENLADDGSGVAAARGFALPYTKAVSYEVLRFSPTVPFVFRKANEDLEINGFDVPKGWSMMLWPGSGGWQAEGMPPGKGSEHPEVFNPDRWLVNEPGEAPQVSNKVPDAYMPFGAGQRICPGKALAEAELGYLLFRVTRDMEFEELDEFETVTAAAQQSHRVRFTRRGEPYVGAAAEAAATA
mmetsp:Transcript_26628/g.85352  ORF Transcript_26628/g.85352 Transcript_26628/m.85352 type:complete len:378 (+) Transcript_26628:61-1194(+)